MSLIFKFGTRKQIFLSYRRESGLWIARTIFYYFRSHGVDCYFDYDSFQDAGHFDEKISGAIREADYFLPILTPGALDIPEDGSENWFRRELELAASLKKAEKIIPLVIKGRDVSLADDSSDEIRQLDTIKRFEIDEGELFEESMLRMAGKCPKVLHQMEGADKEIRKSKITAFREKSMKFYLRCQKGRMSREKRNEMIQELGRQYGIAKVVVEEITQDIAEGLYDRQHRWDWIREYPVMMLMILAIIAGAAIWGAMRLSPDFDQTVRAKAQTAHTFVAKQLHDLGRWIQAL